MKRFGFVLALGAEAEGCLRLLTVRAASPEALTFRQV